MDQTLSLALSNLPAHSALQVALDLDILKSRYGNRLACVNLDSREERPFGRPPPPSLITFSILWPGQN